MAFLLGVGFVLHGDSIDGDAFGLVALKELEEVLRVGAEAELAHGAAQHGVVGLHPSRRAPGRGEKEELGIGLARLAQHGQDVSLVVIDGELFQVGIGRGAVVVAVDGARVVAGTDGGAADIERHLSGSEEVVHHGRALGFVHLAEDVAGRIGERGAEAKHLLARGGGVKHDGGCGHGGGGLPTQRIERGVALVAICCPGADRAVGRGCRPQRQARGQGQSGSGCRRGFQKSSACAHRIMCSL